MLPSVSSTPSAVYPAPGVVSSSFMYPVNGKVSAPISTADMSGAPRSACGGIGGGCDDDVRLKNPMSHPSFRELPVLDPVRLVGIAAQPLVAVDFVLREVAFEERD